MRTAAPDPTRMSGAAYAPSARGWRADTNDDGGGASSQMSWEADIRGWWPLPGLQRTPPPHLSPNSRKRRRVIPMRPVAWQPLRCALLMGLGTMCGQVVRTLRGWSHTAPATAAHTTPFSLRSTTHVVSGGSAAALSRIALA